VTTPPPEPTEPDSVAEPETESGSVTDPEPESGSADAMVVAEPGQVAEAEAPDQVAGEPAEAEPDQPVESDQVAELDQPAEVAGAEEADRPAGSDQPAEPEAPDQAAEAEDAAAADEVLTTSDLPDLDEEPALHAALEALLLVVDGPAEEEILADALDQPVKRIRAALVALAEHYHEHNRGIDLRNVGGGWRFHTRDKFAPFVEKLLLGGQRAKLTRAALESLAVIAYRQPVTRARVAAVRGVNVDGVIRTLLARGLIEETGTDKDTGGILYRTTELFLERLGLSSLEDLPPIAPLLPEVDAIDDV
jgi:segregation and condensation protein B